MSKQFPLLRYFSIASLLVIVTVAIVLSLVFRQATSNKMIQYGEKNNILLTKVLSNTIWPQWESFISTADNLSTEELISDPGFKQFEDLIKTSISNISVLKIKIFNLAGDVRFSTEVAQVGDKKPTYDGVVAARKGEVFTKFEFREKFNSVNGPVTNRYVVSSYLPVLPGVETKPRGIFEVYYDVTDLYSDVKGTNQFIVSLVVLILLGAYAALFGIVKRADTRLKESALERSRHYHQIEEKNQELENLTRQLREARDQALDANRTKSAFVANMSHELRTPLHSIIGYSELLLESQNDGAEDIRKIASSGQYLLNLINQVLDISKIEAGKLENTIDDFDLVDTVHDVSAQLSSIVDKKPVKLNVDIRNDVIEMHSDQTKVRQIIYNLLSNAIKFTDEGNINLLVQNKSLQGENWVQIMVEDSGIGMSEEDMALLFDPFVQVGNQKHEGTGLGMAITKKLVMHLGGRIDVESQLYKGSLFTIELPSYVPETRPLSNNQQLDRIRASYN